jgi:FkbM family methyltransferase
MKYFLDFGTHKFEGLEEFTATLGIDTSWNVHCYEPNTSVFEQMKPTHKQLAAKYASIKIENAAVMDYSGFITLNRHEGAWKDSTKQEYIDGYTTGSNTLSENPITDFGNGVVFNVQSDVCKCFDVNEIIGDIVRTDGDAEIYIKCDIEGSEFKVLPRLLQSNHLANISGLWVEWHERFWYDPDPTKSKYAEKANEHALLEAAFKVKGVAIHFHG